MSVCICFYSQALTTITNTPYGMYSCAWERFPLCVLIIALGLLLTLKATETHGPLIHKWSLPYRHRVSNRHVHLCCILKPLQRSRVRGSTAKEVNIA